MKLGLTKKNIPVLADYDAIIVGTGATMFLTVVRDTGLRVQLCNMIDNAEWCTLDEDGLDVLHKIVHRAKNKLVLERIKEETPKSEQKTEVGTDGKPAAK